ncbi:L,D-transpeptidase family protein [Thiomicrorhabdus cannonii]|uniref:L,D-transpeptidase family protein n=1 Tax=Thiomicrorhabdus cannonii TaxID=2748011 RepID=UPI0015BF3CC8|nr:L,D-transpeptidase family protein [Thiomicrorhabdus cannonii]
MTWLLHSLLFCCALLLQIPAQAASTEMPLSLEAILARSDAMPSPSPFAHPQALRAFYRACHYQPVWQAPAIEALLNSLDQLEADGLNPDNPRYHRTELRALLGKDTLTPNEELLLSDAFLAAAYDLFYGVAFASDANTVFYESGKKSLDLGKTLQTALEQDNITSTLAGLPPKHGYYQNLKKALQRYRAYAQETSWHHNPEDYADRNLVRERLLITGDYPSDCLQQQLRLDNPPSDWCWDANSAEKDAMLEPSIRRFQQRHGLLVDGIVGKRTRNALAQSAVELVERIELNLERWRWYRTLPERYLLVNIPDYTLTLMQDASPLNMKVVVGKQKRPTPLMEDQMAYLVLNPYWRIPKTILLEDVLPKLKSGNPYLQRNQISVFSSGDTKEQQPLNAESINWQAIDGNQILNYVFRQEPGEKNPLGRIKFIFPNSQDIYIHDTSEQHLFKNSTLMASSGCIRAENALQLATQLLAFENPEMDSVQLQEMIQSGEQQIIWLEHKVPVLVTYQTAWADDSGQLFLRPDIYELDDKLLSAIEKLEIRP